MGRRTVEMLKAWLANKNNDLRERKVYIGGRDGTERKTSSAEALDCPEDTVQKRLYMEPPIGHSLNARSTHTRIATHTCWLTPIRRQCNQSLTKPASPLSECTFYLQIRFRLEGQVMVTIAVVPSRLSTSSIFWRP